MSHLRLRLCVALGSLLVLAAPGTALAVGNVVVSQVYGGGGNSGATLKRDFVELYNRTSAPVSLDGWSVQYAASAGTSWQKTDLSGSIAPGGYYLVSQAAGAGGTVDLPAPDASGSIAMSATAGKVILSNSSTLITAGTGCPIANVVDLVGYGTAANCSETSPTATLNNTTAALRNGGGAVDTDSNAADFTIGTPNPHNSGAAPTPPPVIAFGTCGDDTETRIHAIQGTGAATPVPGASRVVEGVVVGDYQASGQFNGYYLQEETADADADALTSEGIFVFSGSLAGGALDVGPGDVVRVRGTVSEFSGLTQIGTLTNAATLIRLAGSL